MSDDDGLDTVDLDTVARACFNAYTKRVGVSTSPDWSALTSVERDAWRLVVRLAWNLSTPWDVFA